MFQQYEGHVLPPAAAIERQIESLGVPPKQKERARQTFSKSAQYAGFFHEGSGRFIRRRAARQRGFRGKTVWEGVVDVFNLEGHPKATRAYAWSSPIEGSDKRRFYAVLHLGGIRSPLDAVGAAIVAERRSRVG
jgi:hypothetical protein